MHRVGLTAGALWFVASGFLLNISGFIIISFLAYLAVAVVGVLLTMKIFTNRSVYALGGLGIGLYLTFSIVGSLVLLFPQHTPAGVETFGSYVSTRFTELIFLTIGLYLGFVAARYLKYLSENVFLIKAR